MNIFARVFSKCAVKTNSNTKSPDPPSQSTASVVSAWYLYMASKYFIHRVSLKVILCSNSLLRHYCVEAGILSPSSSKQCTMPLFFFPPLVALMQHSCSPTMKCVSVPSSTNSPCGTVQKTLRSFRIPAAVQSFTGENVNFLHLKMASEAEFHCQNRLFPLNFILKGTLQRTETPVSIQDNI